ncbi:helix-turn-helix transcriptional regulator [Alistipes sp.]|uniref:helix-turn-helix transcriptional regulator n=1 Tax=Alistipes sp. TaxID=1872444 RepID=UPI003AEF7558
MSKARKKQRRDEILLRNVILRVKGLRELHHHSQEDLNAGTEIDIANLETGANFPNLTTISIICKFYGITLDEFFAPMNYPPKE